MQANCGRARARRRTCSTRLYQFRAHLVQTFCPQLGPSAADKKLDQFSPDEAAVRAPHVTRCAKGTRKPNFCNSKQTVPGNRARVIIGETDSGPYLELNRTLARCARPPRHRLLCRVSQKEPPTSPLPTDKLNGKTTGQSVSHFRLSVPGIHLVSLCAPFPQWPAQSGFR